MGCLVGRIYAKGVLFVKIRFEPALWQVEEMIELHNQAFAQDWQENGCNTAMDIRRKPWRGCC